MKFSFRRPIPVVVVVVLMALAPVASFTVVHAGRDAASDSQANHDVVADGPSLHNPNFDNGRWYEFHLRYQSSYPTGVWVPAGTNMSDTIQDWRIWFLDGTDIVDCDPDEDYVHSGSESVKIRSFSWSSKDHQIAGLYQVIPDTTPCLTYQFSMYGRSRQKEPDDSLTALQVGIEQNGWHPDSANDPAVHSWPSTIVWGTSHKYTAGYGRLVVTAEALADQITVFTYADASGGNSHKIHWDTGSFAEVTPSDLVSDPDSATPNTDGISSGPTVIEGTTSAIVSWQTWAESLGQVYYRFVSSPSTPISPTATLSYTTYLPSVKKSISGSWHSTDLDTTLTGYHFELIDGLLSDATYEYFVASRGLSGASCATWISEKEEFTTLTTQ
jgi:hypothetical protein